MKAAVLFLVYAVTAVYSQNNSTIATSSAYVVQFKVPSLMDGGSLNDIKDANQGFESCLAKENINFTTLETFKYVYAGQSVILHDPLHLEKAKQCSQVKQVSASQFPVQTNQTVATASNSTASNNSNDTFTIQQSDGDQISVGSIPLGSTFEKTDQPTLSSFLHQMTGVNLVKNKLFLTGKGIRIGIIDSGIDWKHPAFGNCPSIGAPGCAIKFGYDFVGDDFDGSNQPMPDDDPMDQCNGHGTHVAGIIAGNSTEIIGVAPEAELGVYRVISCKSGTNLAVIRQALERAYQDGMDLINLSLGADGGIPNSETAKLVDEYSRKGLVIVVAVGNQAAEGTWMVADFASAPTAAAVTSFDSAYGVKRSMTITERPDEPIEIGFNQDPYLPPIPGTHNLEIIVNPHTDTMGVVTFDCCNPLTLDATDKLVLVPKGSCSIGTQVKNIAAAGAKAILLYNNVPSDLGSILTPIPSVRIFTLLMQDGEALTKIIQGSNQPIQAFFSDKDVVINNPVGGRVSEQSTWGIGPDMQIKPDFGAPGGMIRSAFPKRLGSYAVLNGTSMSTPYVVGSYALYLDNIKRMGSFVKWDTRQIMNLRSRYLNYASPMQSRQHSSQYAESVAKQGAGLIQVDKAILGASEATPGKIELGVLETNMIRTILIRNTGVETKQYSLSTRLAETVNVTISSKINSLDSASKVAFKSLEGSFLPKIEIALGPGEEREMTLQFMADSQVSADQNSQFLISGYIQIQPKSLSKNKRDESDLDHVITVPFCGLQGDLQKLQIFDLSIPQYSPAVGYIKAYKTQPALIPTTGLPKGPITVENFDQHADSMIIVWRQLVPIENATIVLLDANTRQQLGTIYTIGAIARHFTDPNLNYPGYIKLWNSSYVDSSGNFTSLKTGNYTVQLQYKQLDNIVQGLQKQTSPMRGLDLQTIQFATTL